MLCAYLLLPLCIKAFSSALVRKVFLAFSFMAGGAKQTEPQVHFNQEKQKHSR